MSFLELLAGLLSAGIGMLVADRCWANLGAHPTREGQHFPPRSWADRCLRLFLGWPVGVGITASLFFGCSLFTTKPAFISGIAELLLAGVLLCGKRGGARPPGALDLILRSGPKSVGRYSAPGPSPAALAKGEGRVPPSLLDRLLLSLLVQLAVVALLISLRAARLEPWGSWDGWAIWNLHARFLFRAGPTWPALLASPDLSWTHPDYPWLVSASVARLWSWMGRESGAASAHLSLCFGVATAGLLCAALWRRRGAAAACLATAVLLSTPFFVTFSSNEHADIPFGLYVLASCVLLAEGPSSSRSLALLTGFVIGLAPWVKNEGLLWLPLAVVAWCATFPFRQGFGGRAGRNLSLSFLGGLLLALLPLLYFKLRLAPPNDLAASHPANHLAQLLAADRHHLILSSLRRDLRGFGQWTWTPFLALALGWVGPGWRRLTRSEWAVAPLLALMLAGYYGVYLLSPFELHWHLDSSLVRLLLQLWPAALFFWGLAASLPAAEQVALHPPNVRPSSSQNAVSGLTGSRATRSAWLLGNALCAAVFLWHFSQRLAPGELARSHFRLAPVHAVAAEGWYPPEMAGSSHWAWSSGSATLRLYSATPQKVHLRFAVRGLQPQQIQATCQGRVIWSAAVGTVLQRGEIAELELPAGRVEVIFSSNRPGVPESGDARSRTLAFALYQLQIE